jgi:hypothetical protein
MSESDGHDDEHAFRASSVRAFHDRLDAPVDADDLLEELRALEELKDAICARQARLAVVIHERQRRLDIRRGIDAAATTRFAGSQVAFARRCAPRVGTRLLGMAHALIDAMPHTYAALVAGVISEWDATQLVRETAGLSPRNRTAVDRDIDSELGRVSSRRLVALARESAYRLDPAAIAVRRARAESERRVTVRPAPDCMAYLNALLPVKEAMACLAALDAAAKASGGPRGPAMADALTTRVTGRDRAHVPDVHVDLLMPLDTLTGDTAAHVPGYGPIPAGLAREWVRDIDPVGARVRRLFTYPGSGDVVAMESRARRYPGLLAYLIIQRDQECRTPWCGAPIRHTDHIGSHAKGGRTSERNAAGLCVRCNYVKEHPDYRVTGDATATVTRIGTLMATSHPPKPPGLPPPTRSPVERRLMDAVWLRRLGS